MKKTNILLLAITFSHSVFGQYLFMVGDNNPIQWVVAYPQDEFNVNIRIKDFSPSHRYINDEIYEYYFYRDKVLYDYVYLDGEVAVNGKEYESFDCFPLYIRTRNNNYKYGYLKNDSIVINRKGRICEVYSFSVPSEIIKQSWQRKTILKYISDTVIISYDFEKKTGLNSFSVSFLDSLQNIKMFYWPESDSLICDSVYAGKMTVFDIKNWEGTRFKYNKNRNRIVSIQHIYCTNGKEVLMSSQYFSYKNGKPISSYTIDERAKKRIYEQRYLYKLYKR